MVTESYLNQQKDFIFEITFIWTGTCKTKQFKPKLKSKYGFLNSISLMALYQINSPICETFTTYLTDVHNLPVRHSQLPCETFTTYQ